jgi:hypothetical protein
LQNQTCDVEQRIRAACHANLLGQRIHALLVGHEGADEFRQRQRLARFESFPWSAATIIAPVIASRPALWSTTGTSRSALAIVTARAPRITARSTTTTASRTGATGTKSALATGPAVTAAALAFAGFVGFAAREAGKALVCG